MRAGKAAPEPTVTNYDPQALAARRMAAGLTQLGLAKAIGVKSIDVARWESGTRGIPSRSMSPLARMLCCTVQDICPDGGKEKGYGR